MAPLLKTRGKSMTNELILPDRGEHFGSLDDVVRAYKQWLELKAPEHEEPRVRELPGGAHRPRLPRGSLERHRSVGCRRETAEADVAGDIRRAANRKEAA